MTKGQARIHRKFYEPSTERHDGLTLRCIENMEEIGEQVEKKGWHQIKEGYAKIDGEWHSARFKAVLDWEYLEVTTSLERPCSSGSFVIGWADIVALYKTWTTDFWLIDERGEKSLDEIEAHGWEWCSEGVSRYFDSWYASHLDESYWKIQGCTKFGDEATYVRLTEGPVYPIQGPPPSQEMFGFKIIIEVKPELKSASSIIRQLNEYRSLIAAERSRIREEHLHKVIVTYDSNTKYDPLFNSENITVIRYEEMIE